MRKVFILVFSFFILLPGYTQLGKYFDGGIVGGLTASQVDGDTYAGFNKVGFLAGGYAQRMFTYTVAGQMELRYIMKGAFSSDNEYNPHYYKLILHYIDIPLMIQYHYRENVIFDIGISPEFLVYHQEWEDVNSPTKETGAPEFHRITFSALGGVGYTFWDIITVNARYGYSIIPIRDHPSGQTYLLNRGQYNNVLMFGVYYQISR